MTEQQNCLSLKELSSIKGNCLHQSNTHLKTNSCGYKKVCPPCFNSEHIWISILASQIFCRSLIFNGITVQPFSQQDLVADILFHLLLLRAFFSNILPHINLFSRDFQRIRSHIIFSVILRTSQYIRKNIICTCLAYRS